MSQPWMKFFGSDWCGDQGLRSCTLAARGLWLEMLLVMDRAEPRGSLLLNGKQIDTRRLASIVGSDKRDVEAFFRELDDAGVFSRDDDGTVFSRKMRRDEARAERDKANGKGGGNPTLKPKDKPPDKPKPTEGLTGGVNPKDKAQKLEARIQKEAAQFSAEAAKASGRPDLDAVENALRKAAGLENSPSPSLCILTPILGRIEGGMSLEADILPVIRSFASRGKQGASWDYYTAAIDEAAMRKASGKAAALAIPTNGRDASTMIDMGWERPVPEENLIFQIGHLSPAWLNSRGYSSPAEFRKAVAEHAPNLLKFWPDEPLRGSQ